MFLNHVTSVTLSTFLLGGYVFQISLIEFVGGCASHVAIKPLGIFCKILHGVMIFKNTYVASSRTDCMVECLVSEMGRELSLLLGLGARTEKQSLGL